MTYHRVLSPSFSGPTRPLNTSNPNESHSRDVYEDLVVKKARGVRTHTGFPDHGQGRRSPEIINRPWQSTAGPLHSPNFRPHNVATGPPLNEASLGTPRSIRKPEDSSTMAGLENNHSSDITGDSMQMRMQMRPSPSLQASLLPQPSENHSSSEKTINPPSPAVHELSAPEPHPKMLKQPMTNAITEEALINEVRGIYAGLVMVEKKCIEVDKQQMDTRAELSTSQWQALISLHRTLLYEHHDFFLASQHPSASDVLKRLAEKYAMPARMWRYGIHSFLELLRQNLPASLDYMLNFIYVAYSMITLLYESVRAFQDTWIECLGDLARYRMAVEESDMKDRENWANVSRYWYNQNADRSPEVGRIQHHLAVLARPDGLLQLFHYTKALVCVRPFQNARDSINLLFNPFKEQPLGQKTIITAFIATHGILFAQDPEKQLKNAAKNFLSLLQEDYQALGRQGQQGVFIMCSNIASILQYGKPDAIMEVEFAQEPGDTAEAAHKFAKEWNNNSITEMMDLDGGSHDLIPPHVPSLIATHGSELTFQTFSVFLRHIEDHDSYPSVHAGLAFIWCLALHPTAIQQVERIVPWQKIVQFLNKLEEQNPQMNKSIFEQAPFPSHENLSGLVPIQSNMVEHLPEDFMLRGNVWSQLYYPENFFQNALQEDERPAIENAESRLSRVLRCLWLGCRIATVRISAYNLIYYYRTN